MVRFWETNKKRKGFLRVKIEPEDDGTGGLSISSKLERAIHQSALDQIFGTMKKSGNGNHKTKYTGNGDEQSGDQRNY